MTYPIPKYAPLWIFAISINRRTSNLTNSLAHGVELIIPSYLSLKAIYTLKVEGNSLRETVRADLYSFP